MEMIEFYFFCVLVLLKETDLFMLGVKNDTRLIFFFFLLNVFLVNDIQVWELRSGDSVLAL